MEREHTQMFKTNPTPDQHFTNEPYKDAPEPKPKKDVISIMIATKNYKVEIEIE